MALTPKQARFVDEYLVDLNGTQAAIRAGYAAKSASVEGTRQLANASVAAELANRMAAKAESINLTSDLVLQGLLLEAQGNPRFEDTTAPARVAAWKALGEHLKLFTTRIENTGTTTHRVISGIPLDEAAWADAYEATEQPDSRH